LPPVVSRRDKVTEVARILLSNRTYRFSNSGARGSIIDPNLPTLEFAAIAARARQRGHRLKILDLSRHLYDRDLRRSEILEAKPDALNKSEYASYPIRVVAEEKWILPP
jgi:hypothetical protein